MSLNTLYVYSAETRPATTCKTMTINPMSEIFNTLRYERRLTNLQRHHASRSSSSELVGPVPPTYTCSCTFGINGSLDISSGDDGRFSYEISLAMVDVRDSVVCDSGDTSTESGEREVAGAMVIEGAGGFEVGGVDSMTDGRVVSFDDDCSGTGFEGGVGVELPLLRMALAVDVVLRAAPSVLKGGGKEDCLEAGGAGEGDRLRLRLNKEPRLTCSESLLRCTGSEEEAGVGEGSVAAEEDSPDPPATGSDVVLACVPAFFFSSASFFC